MRHGTPQHRPDRPRRGFTLIEILVVILIMVVIASIAIPMVNQARKKGVKVRVAADLQAIGVALDAYKGDFNDYPRFTSENDNPALDAPTVPDTFLNGAEILCLALIGPRSMNGADGIPAGQPGDTFDGDGADGPGFRTSVAPPGTTPDERSRSRGRTARTYGPYLDATKFQVADPANPSPDLKQHEPRSLVMMSYYGTPILYFPARPQKAPIETAFGYVANIPASPVPDGDPVRRSMWDVRYGVRFFRHGAEGNDNVSINRIRAMLGDVNYSGHIQPGETPAHSGGFALWSAGLDDKWGPASITETPPTSPDDVKKIRQAVEDCDDVTNFR